MMEAIPDILKNDGYPDVQVFMATYREAEAVVDSITATLPSGNARQRKAADPPKKDGMHRPKEKVSVIRSGGYKQRARDGTPNPSKRTSEGTVTWNAEAKNYAAATPAVRTQIFRI